MAGNVKSPNGNIEVKFSVDNTGRPVYEMTYKGKAVVKPSHLGLELAKDKHASKGMQETDLMDGFKIAKEETTSFDETWQPVWGETKDIRNHYNELAATLEQPATKRTMIIRFRVYDDGIGFRYEFPQQQDVTSSPSSRTSTTSSSRRSVRSLQWRATTRPGGSQATTTHRSR